MTDTSPRVLRSHSAIHCPQCFLLMLSVRADGLSREEQLYVCHQCSLAYRVAMARVPAVEIPFESVRHLG